jgi:hypothetical protein
VLTPDTSFECKAQIRVVAGFEFQPHERQARS